MPSVKVNGVRLNYVDKGEGPPIVLSHGFQNSIFAFKPIIDRLAAEFRVLALDKRGHGDSEKPPGPYSIQNFADDLLAFLDHLGLEKVDFLGHSMGGRTGTLFGIEHSDRLKRLMLVSSSAGAPTGGYRERFAVLREIALTEGIEAIMGHPQFRRLLPPLLLEGPTAEEYRVNFLKNTPQGYAATADALLQMEDLTERLGAISVPTWVCYGEHETEPIKYGDIYMARIPNCTRVILPGSGHFPVWDATEPFLEAVHAFMEKTPVA